MEDQLFELRALLDVAGAASQKLAQEKAEKKAAAEAALELEKQAKLDFEKAQAAEEAAEKKRLAAEAAAEKKRLQDEAVLAARLLKEAAEAEEARIAAALADTSSLTAEEIEELNKEFLAKKIDARIQNLEDEYAQKAAKETEAFEEARNKRYEDLDASYKKMESKLNKNYGEIDAAQQNID